MVRTRGGYTELLETSKQVWFGALQTCALQEFSLRPLPLVPKDSWTASPDSTRTSQRRLYHICIYICKMYFVECLLICTMSIGCFLYYRHTLDVFKMFMIYNVCKTDTWKTSVRRLYTADAFQIKRSLTDILQTYVSVFYFVLFSKVHL